MPQCEIIIANRTFAENDLQHNLSNITAMLLTILTIKPYVTDAT